MTPLLIFLALLAVPLFIAGARRIKQANAMGDNLGAEDRATGGIVLCCVGIVFLVTAGARWLLGVS